MNATTYYLVAYRTKRDFNEELHGERHVYGNKQCVEGDFARMAKQGYGVKLYADGEFIKEAESF